jgi:hypothetical protein
MLKHPDKEIVAYLDDQGNLASPEEATRLRFVQYGVNDQGEEERFEAYCFIDPSSQTPTSS